MYAKCTFNYFYTTKHCLLFCHYILAIYTCSYCVVPQFSYFLSGALVLSSTTGS